MNTRLRFASLLSLVLLLVLPVEAVTPPPHPTAILADYDGKPREVVAVEKDQAIVLVDGNRKKIRASIPLQTERVARYSEAGAVISNVKVAGVQLVEAMSEFDVDKTPSSSTVAGFIELSAQITADQDLSNCYVALVSFDRAFVNGTVDKPNSQIRIRQIPDLKKNEPTAIKFAASPFVGRASPSVFVLLFSDGQEVQTNTSPVTNAYFQRRERVLFNAVLKRFLAENPTATQLAMPVLQIPPLMRSTEKFPSDGVATLSVAPDGTVVAVVLNGDFSKVTTTTLENALSGWLFLPKIERGQPVHSRVKVPLKF